MIINITLVITAIVITALLAETLIIRRHVNKFTLRVLVNGTRGKSSVVKYIHTGLVNNSTFAKVTGVIPTMLFPNGEEKPINRKGAARVQEQVKMIRYAAGLKADNIVLECMSINPELQKLESHILKPQIYVITNIRNDHPEQMGKDELQQVYSICNAIPRSCIVITAEKVHVAIIREFAVNRNSTVVEVDEMVYPELPEHMHAVNVALAATVCEQAGIDKKNAIDAIINSERSPEPVLLKLPGDTLFLNGFAVNDIPSASDFIKKWLDEIKTIKKVSFIFNSRNDRPLRTIQFAEWFSTNGNIERIILTGNHKERAMKELVKHGFEKEKISVWNSGSIESFVDSIMQCGLEGNLIIGIGNIAGDGFKILKKLKGMEV